MIEIVLPDDPAERMAWLTAWAAILMGGSLMVFPQRVGRFLGLVTAQGTKNGLSEIRGPFAGMWLGLGLACILLAQPFTYFALALAFAFAVFGRLLSFVFDRTLNIRCVIATVIEIVGAYFPLVFALRLFGLV